MNYVTARLFLAILLCPVAGQAWAEASLATITNQTFNSQEVRLAGTNYLQCSFTNCVIIIDGTSFGIGQCDFVNCKWDLSLNLKITNSSSVDFRRLSQLLDAIRSGPVRQPAVPQLFSKTRSIVVAVLPNQNGNFSFEVQRKFHDQGSEAAWKSVFVGVLSQFPSDPGFLAYSDTGLSPSTYYDYRVRRIDGDGHVSVWSETGSITTLPGP
jgi:hypothetical protein